MIWTIKTRPEKERFFGRASASTAMRFRETVGGIARVSQNQESPLFWSSQAARIGCCRPSLIKRARLADDVAMSEPKLARLVGLRQRLVRQTTAAAERET